MPQQLLLSSLLFPHNSFLFPSPSVAHAVPAHRGPPPPAPSPSPSPSPTSWHPRALTFYPPSLSSHSTGGPKPLGALPPPSPSPSPAGNNGSIGARSSERASSGRGDEPERVGALAPHGAAEPPCRPHVGPLVSAVTYSSREDDHVESRAREAQNYGTPWPLRSMPVP